MPVDPQIQALLDRGTGVPATHTLPVAEARRQYEARIALMAPAPEMASVVERSIDGEGGPLKLRIYTPFGTHWYPYFMRRLAERPANVIFLLKNFFKS